MSSRREFLAALGLVGAPLPVSAKGGGFRAMWMLSPERSLNPAMEWVSVYFEREGGGSSGEIYDLYLATVEGFLAAGETSPRVRVPLRPGEQFAQLEMFLVPRGSRLSELIIDVYQQVETVGFSQLPPGVTILSDSV